MAISLVKGQKISLTKSGSGAGSGNLNRVMVGLGWDAIGGGKGGFFANILNTERSHQVQAKDYYIKLAPLYFKYRIQSIFQSFLKCILYNANRSESYFMLFPSLKV